MSTSSLGKRKNYEESSVSSVVSFASSKDASSKDSTKTGSSPRTPKCQLPSIASLLHPCCIEPNRALRNTVFMPMIPYYYHHKQFGIESCMLQLEAQNNFNNYYL